MSKLSKCPNIYIEHEQHYARFHFKYLEWKCFCYILEGENIFFLSVFSQEINFQVFKCYCFIVQICQNLICLFCSTKRFRLDCQKYVKSFILFVNLTYSGPNEHHCHKGGCVVVVISCVISHLTLHLVLLPLTHLIPSNVVSFDGGEHFLILMGTSTDFIWIVQSLTWTVWQISQSSTYSDLHRNLQ